MYIRVFAAEIGHSVWQTDFHKFRSWYLSVRFELDCPATCARAAHALQHVVRRHANSLGQIYEFLEAQNRIRRQN